VLVCVVRPKEPEGWGVSTSTLNWHVGFRVRRATCATEAWTDRTRASPAPRHSLTLPMARTDAGSAVRVVNRAGLLQPWSRGERHPPCNPEDHTAMTTMHTFAP
jgi:hypothetical protein